MFLKQYYLGCLAHASYLVADERARVAAVVDPQRDVEQYLDDAARRGLAIRHVLLTHLHADFVPGHLELAARTGATIHLGARASAEYAFQPERDGAEVDLGRVRLRVLETPGHTPESISILVFDLEKSASEPHAVFTGDTLFVGDVGRPDLLVSVGVSSRELASMLYDSLRTKLARLPDATIVYPAHGAGSACGKKLSQETSSTIGAQRALNWALQPMERARFVDELVADQPCAPAYFGFDAALNRKQRETLDECLQRALVPLALDEVLRLREAGAIVLDARDPDAYAREHLAGSLNVGLGGKYANWCGEMLRPSQTLAIVADPSREREAVLRLGRIGFDRVAGYLQGGAAAWAGRRELLRGHERIDAAELARRLASAHAPLVVDVRARSEWDAGHVDGARNEPLSKLAELAARLPRDRDLVVQCQSGYRSSIAASLLERLGFERIADLRGGWLGWQELRAGLPR